LGDGGSREASCFTKQFLQFEDYLFANREKCWQNALKRGRPGSGGRSRRQQPLYKSDARDSGLFFCSQKEFCVRSGLKQRRRNGDGTQKPRRRWTRKTSWACSIKSSTLLKRRSQCLHGFAPRGGRRKVCYRSVVKSVIGSGGRGKTS